MSWSGDDDVMTKWTAAETREAYDEVADTYADHFATTAPEAPIDLAMIAHFTSLLPDGARVLDAGCGAGRMMPVLADLGCDVVGVDLSPEMIRRAALDHPEQPSSVASLTELPFEDGTFDGVFAWYSTIHSSDEEVGTMLREFRRVLCPGGHVLVAFQSGAGVRDVADGYRRRGHDVVLVRWGRSVEWMRRALSAAGFTAVAALDRAAVEGERDGQGFVIARVGDQPA